MAALDDILPRARSIDLAAVLQRLANLGAASEVRRGAPREAGLALGFDRVLLTSVRRGQLEAETLYIDGDVDSGALLDELRAHPVALAYPLVEGEILRRRRAQIVDCDDVGDARNRAFADTLGWRRYVAAPVALDGRVIGFFHADRGPDGPAVDDDDVDRLAAFALCFALVFDRAQLRHRLRVQREQMRNVADWAQARSSDLEDRSTVLGNEGEEIGQEVLGQRQSAGAGAFRDLLTRREIEVLELMVGGATNAVIARELVLSEGTVKFHVKNILRKLHATNRAEATSRYLRLTLTRSVDPDAG